LIAVGSGGITGKGQGKGTQAKLGYLPQSVATNDFIFSVIAEEYGFTGGIFVLLIYAIMMANGLRIACMARDRFGLLLAVGISILFLIHICVNIGMTLGIMPITGIPLPFISYGGSFMVICFILQGIIQSIYRFKSKY
jgi:rod shape determining protein RodA